MPDLGGGYAMNPQVAQMKASVPRPNGAALLSDLLREQKGFSKIYNPDNTTLMFADPQRATIGQKTGRQLEYWPPDEEGTADFPRPSGTNGKHVLEIYRDDLRSNPTALKQAAYGDLLHGMKLDPVYAQMRQQFIANYPPKVSQFNQSLKAKGQNQDSIDDMYIRGWLSPDERDEFRKAQASGDQRYSPEQLKILEQMRSYISTGATTPAQPPIQ